MKVASVLSGLLEPRFQDKKIWQLLHKEMEGFWNQSRTLIKNQKDYHSSEQ